MQLGKTSRSSILILLSHAGRASNTSEDVDRAIAALSSLGSGSATWVLAEQSVIRLEPSTRERLRTRIIDHDDDVLLQGAYGIPHGVLGDRELHFEVDVTRRAAARAIEIPEERVRDLMAPAEPDTRRLAALAAGRPVILGVSPHRGFHRLWVTFEGRHASFPLVRLGRIDMERWWRRHAVLAHLGRGSPGVCAVDPHNREALSQLERLAPNLTAVPLDLPASPAVEVAPPHLDPLIPVERTPIWHARLLSAAAARPKTRRGRVSSGVLRPFAAGPEELVRETSFGSPLYDNRVVHASMQGSVRMTEGELTAQFAGGVCIGLASSPTGPFPLPPDPGSVLCNGKERSFQVSGAFSFDWDTARGLTTRLTCAPDRLHRAGRQAPGATEGRPIRVEADYLFLDGLPWLVVRATVHYPEDGLSCHARPIPIPLGRAARASDVAIRAWRHDGGEWEPLVEARAERTDGHVPRFLRIPAAGMSVSLGGDPTRGLKTHVVFIDEGHGLTWEPAVQIGGSAARPDLYLLPFGRFETAATGITSASILFALSLQDEVPDVAALRKRVLRVLPAPSAIPAGLADQGSPT